MKSSGRFFIILSVTAFFLSMFNVAWQVQKRKDVTDIRFVVLETKVEIILNELKKLQEEKKIGNP